MFEKLKDKWKVSGSNLIMILVTFAVGGSLTGYVAKKILSLLPVDKGAFWILLYILLLTVIWPVAVVIVSIPFGQSRFFRDYIKRIAGRLGRNANKQKISGMSPAIQPSAIQSGFVNPDASRSIRIAIFASGAGTNAQKIIDSFRDHPFIKVALIVCNRPGAGVLQIAEKEKIPFLLIERDAFYDGNGYVDELKQQHIDFIVLAGFLWKVPSALIKAFPQRIINIHPALLPAYGGKGMYGIKVQEAVIVSGDPESGITIHYVDEIYDHGQIIFQASCPVLPDDTPAILAKKIHQLEHLHFSRVIEELLSK